MSSKLIKNSTSFRERLNIDLASNSLQGHLIAALPENSSDLLFSSQLAGGSNLFDYKKLRLFPYHKRCKLRP